MHTELQSAILAALRIRHPEAMSNDDIRTATGDYASISHALACTIACLQLLQNDEIELVEGGKKWKLTDTGTPVPGSHLGDVGTEAGDGRKLLPPSEDHRDAPLREAAESSQSGHGFAPSPANSGATGSCGDNLHAFQPHAERAVSLPTPARELPDTPMCTAPAGLDIQIGAEIATDGDQHKCSGSTPSRAETLCAGDVPQPLSAESMSCGERAATGKDEGAATSREANGRQIKIAQQDCGSVEAFPRIPQVSSIPDGVEGNDRAAGLDLLSPECAQYSTRRAWAHGWNWPCWS